MNMKVSHFFLCVFYDNFISFKRLNLLDTTFHISHLIPAIRTHPKPFNCVLEAAFSDSTGSSIQLTIPMK